MTPYNKRSCPITQRLAEDLMIRNMAAATIDAYTYHVRRFADFIQKPLDRVTPEDVRTFQLHLIREKKLAYSTFNQAVCALRFFYRHTEPMSWPVTMVPFGKRPKTLPVVLSRSEHQEARLSACTSSFVRDRTFGSGRGSVDDQPSARTRQLHHNDAISALPPGASSQYAQSAGLAASPATSDVHTAGRKPSAAPTVAEILRWGAPRATSLNTPVRVRDTLAKLALCRTHVMGGRLFQCEECNETTTLYNSCGDRHCPQCSGSKRMDFHEKASKLIVDGQVYYQVVMTLPSALSELASSNRELFGSLLPGSAWSSLDRSIRSEQGYQAAAISVLHTWNQQLRRHWHVHLLVPGAGPSTGGDHWTKATPPPGSNNDEGFYLVDADTLRSRFRKTCLRRLQRARTAGKLKLIGRHAYLQDDDNWTAFVNQLESKTWVAYIQPPPTTESKAQHVVNYLTRYLTGGPISDHRIVSANRLSVTFLAREGKQIGGQRKQVPITISTIEFTQRWSEHIQPDQWTKVRYFGGWSNSKVGTYMQQCHDLAPACTNQAPAQAPAQVDPPPTDIVCDNCGSDRMVFLAPASKPSWRELLGYGSSATPLWYAELRDQSDRIFWDGLMGEGFNAWYLENLIESAKETDAQPPPPIQLHLPGFELTNGYPLDSF